MVLAAVVAIASAFCFAGSTSLQHRAAGEVTPVGPGSAALFLALVRHPLWVAGAATGAVAFLMHGWALTLGAIAFVQPVMLIGVVLAVLFRSLLAGRLPATREVLAVGVTMAGLALFVVMTDDAARHARADAGTAIPLTIATLAGVGLLVVGAAQLRSDARRSFCLGASSGALFGLTAGYLKYIGADVGTDGLLGGLLTWKVLALVSIGLTGVVINQHAYRAARLAASMPVLNVVSVVGAVTFGWVVFGQPPTSGGLPLLVQVLALGVVGYGLTLLGRVQDVLDPESAGASPVLGGVR